MSISAEFIPDTTIVINEINYNSSPDFPAGDWIEFYNSSNRNIDMSGWKFMDSDDEHLFRFPAGSVLQPDSFYVLCRDSALFTLLFPQVENIAGYFDFGLNNGGELLRLYNNEDYLVDSLTYSDTSPWPVEPDGSGATLILRDAFTDNSLPENWTFSELYGTPGQSNQEFLAVYHTKSVLPLKYDLGQNYPNPFNPDTRIPLTVAGNEKIKLIVYDIRGRLVETLIDGNMDPGKYVVQWQPGREIASGIYFYRLVIQNTQTITRKLVYLR